MAAVIHSSEVPCKADNKYIASVTYTLQPNGKSARVISLAIANRTYVDIDISGYDPKKISETLLERISWLNCGDMDRFISKVDKLGRRQIYDIFDMLFEVGMISKSDNCSRFLGVIVEDDLRKTSIEWQLKTRELRSCSQTLAKLNAGFSAEERALDIKSEVAAGDLSHLYMGLHPAHPSNDSLISYLETLKGQRFDEVSTQLNSLVGISVLQQLGDYRLNERYSPNVPHAFTLEQRECELQDEFILKFEEHRQNIKLWAESRSAAWRAAHTTAVESIDRAQREIAADQLI